MQRKFPLSGILAAFATPILLGMAPIFGKLAIQADVDPFSVAALRTVIAVLLLWTIYLLFFRRFIYIYPAGLMGCIVVGTINGIGSLFYYSGLTHMNASMAQLLNGMYLPLAVLLSSSAGQKVDKRTFFRVLLAVCGLLIVTGFGEQRTDWLGVGLMLGNALMFAGTVILSQYVLYEMPAPTVTLYVLSTMAVVVSMVWMTVGQPLPQATMNQGLAAIFALAVTTALSRLAMFAGVKFMGGIQTAVLSITEIGVALLLAAVILNDRLTGAQWLGVAVLAGSILLIRQRDLLPRGFNPNALIVANMASVQFQRIAFHRAFGTSDTDNESGTMANITTQELALIQRMMGAQTGPIDPFPIGKVGMASATNLKLLTDTLEKAHLQSDEVS